MGPYGSKKKKKKSKHYSPYRLQPKVFKLLLNFLSNGTRKTTFEIFDILKTKILTICFDLFSFSLPNGIEDFKMQLILEIQVKTFPNLSFFFLSVVFKKLHWEFLKIWLFDLFRKCQIHQFTL